MTGPGDNAIKEQLLIDKSQVWPQWRLVCILDTKLVAKQFSILTNQGWYDNGD